MTDAAVAGTTRYPHLLSPFTLAGRTLQNRVVMLPHGTAMVVDGAITDDDIEYYRRRAATRPGMMVSGAAVVHPTSARRQRMLVEDYSEHVLPGLAQRAEMIRSYGVVAIGQLIHLGREMIGVEGEFPPLAPSPIRSPRDPFLPQVLDTTTIRELVAAFAHSAANLRATGHDGAEIHAAHGYLPAQFLSPATNARDDAYGGDPERRFRFLREVIEAIRDACGADLLLGVRLSADEEIADGLEVTDTVEIARRLQAIGGVDYLSITVGVRGAYVKDATQPEAPAARAAATIRNACAIPVIVGQRIARPELAEQLLADGQADMVGLARAFIADPEWLDHVRAGAAARIRPCIGVNQECRAFSPHLHCAVNPQTGRERTAPFAPAPPTPPPRRVAVIGAGPAGLEAARSLALRGSQVTVFERGGSIGGQFAFAAALPYRQALGRFIDFHAGELRRLEVSVLLAREVAGPGDLDGEFDAVVVATGARANPVPADLRADTVLSWWSVLEDPPSPRGEGHAVVVDDGTGFWWNYGVAETLVRAGWRVSYVTPSLALAHQIPHESIGPLLARLGRGGTRYHPLAQLVAVDAAGATIMDLTSGETQDIPCDLVVLQTGRAPDPTGLLHVFGGSGVHRIGDCLTPRRMANAVFEGQRLGLSL